MRAITVFRLIFSFVCVCLLLMQNLRAVDYVLAQEPPPRPTPGAGSGNQNNGGGNSGKGNSAREKGYPGDITGTVKDLSTGLPGAGLIVMINDIAIRTDTSGRFSLTGIADGIYTVKLALPAHLTPAETSQSVTIANRSKVDILLGYYSSIEPPPMVETSPQEMPETGGASIWVYLNRGDIIGIIIFLLGLSLQIWGRNLSKMND